METPSVELKTMTSLGDYRVSSEDIDPRAWDTLDSNGVLLGQITDLIIDVQALTARYIVVTGPGMGMGAGTGARSVLIPVGFARLDKEHCKAHLDFVTSADVAQLPTFTGLPLSDEDALKTEKALTGATPPPAAESKIVRRNV